MVCISRFKFVLLSDDANYSKTPQSEFCVVIPCFTMIL